MVRAIFLKFCITRVDYLVDIVVTLVCMYMFCHLSSLVTSTSKLGRFSTTRTFNNLVQCLDKPLDFIHFDILLAKSSSKPVAASKLTCVIMHHANPHSTIFSQPQRFSSQSL